MDMFWMVIDVEGCEPLLLKGMPVDKPFTTEICGKTVEITRYRKLGFGIEVDGEDDYGTSPDQGVVCTHLEEIDGVTLTFGEYSV